MGRPLHGDKSRFVAHKSETSGCNYCHSPYKAKAKKHFLFFCCFSFSIYFSPAPLWFFFFTTGGLKSLAAHLFMPFSFFCVTHSWLSNRLVSQRREGDSDLLSAQPQNNKITSLPACSGHGNSIDGNLVSQIIFLLNVAGRREWFPLTKL